jgi:hypothetical protein
MPNAKTKPVVKRSALAPIRRPGVKRSAPAVDASARLSDYVGARMTAGEREFLQRQGDGNASEGLRVITRKAMARAALKG